MCWTTWYNRGQLGTGCRTGQHGTSRQHGSAQFGTVRHSSAQFGTVRHSSTSNLLQIFRRHCKTCCVVGAFSCTKFIKMSEIQESTVSASSDYEQKLGNVPLNIEHLPVEEQDTVAPSSTPKEDVEGVEDLDFEDENNSAEVLDGDDNKPIALSTASGSIENIEEKGFEELSPTLPSEQKKGI